MYKVSVIIPVYNVEKIYRNPVWIVFFPNHITIMRSYVLMTAVRIKAWIL